MRIIENTIIIDPTPVASTGVMVIPSPEFDALRRAEKQRQNGTLGKWDDRTGWENPDGMAVPWRHIDLRGARIIVTSAHLKDEESVLAGLDLRGAKIVVEAETGVIPLISMRNCLIDEMTTIPEGWKWAHWESGTIGSVKRVPCGIAHSSIKNQYFGSRDLRDTPSRWVITN